jgi:hypothetical protein
MTSAGVRRLPHYTSTTAVGLFMRQPDDLDISAVQQRSLFATNANI